MSYYIILCKFCELDTDRDQRITKDELLRYSNYSLTTRIVDRIFEVCRFSYPGAPGYHANKNYFNFADFACKYRSFNWFNETTYWSKLI